MITNVQCSWWVKRGYDEWHCPATGATCVGQYPPIGALYNAPWIVEQEAWREQPLKQYPDKLCLVCITPSGPWLIDGPSFDGKQHHPCPWTREGDPRYPSTVSVEPSINFQSAHSPDAFHGWLKNGRLYDA